MTILLLFILLFCSAVVSASETSLFGLSRRDLKEFRTSPSASARRVALLMARPRRCLLTILLLNVALNVTIYAVSFVALGAATEHDAFWVSVGGIGALLSVTVFGEMIPKRLAFSRTKALAPYAAAGVEFMQLVLAPFRWMLGGLLVEPLTRLLIPDLRPRDEVSTEELRKLVEQSSRDGVIDKHENQMLQGSLSMAQTKVREVMTPRVDVQSIPLTSDTAAARGLMKSSRRHSLLVRGRNLDELHGVVFARDLNIQPHRSLVALARSLSFVPEQCNLLQLIRFFREQRIESAVVVDEYGGTSGVVSLVDIAKRIVGELGVEDVLRPVTVEEIDSNTYRIPGDFSVRLWAERFGVEEIDGHVDTVAGLVLTRLGKLPRVGDSIRIRNLTLTVDQMEPRRIVTVLLRREPLPNQEAES